MSVSGKHPLPRPQMPSRLTVGPFTLQAMAESDWPLVVEMSRDADVVRWTFYPDNADEAGARDWLRQALASAADGTAARFVIGDECAAALGTCGIGGLDEETPEVFYALLPRGRGRGAATLATHALASWALSAGYGSVGLETEVGNVASEDVARRCGFEPVRVFPGEHRGRPAELTRWLARSPTAP
jgi:RimJ/RimL family protein N-acetyltransferase